MARELLRNIAGMLRAAARHQARTLLALGIMLGASAAWGDGCPGCNPPSKHPVDWCTIGGSNNDPVVSIGRDAEGLDVAAALRQACDLYATAHSTATVVSSFGGSCTPVLPAPNFNSFGGTFGTYLADGVINSYLRSTGQLISSAGGPWGMATCGCVDSRNMNLVGLGTEGSCYCRQGQFWDDTIRACVPTPPPTLKIRLEGPSSTKALIAGPALPQKAHVSQNGLPVGGKAVTISIASGATYNGTTDGFGDFWFTYVPPYRETVDTLTGTCTGCSNTAQKQITVEPCDACVLKGNPISIATGEKQQSETDWQDSAAHPLTYTRHYRSFANVEAGLGLRWSHNFAARATRQDLEATIRLGDGSKVLFSRANLASAWVADNKRDSLAELPSGLVYTRASDESRWAFDSTGKLASITARNGWTMTLAYDANSRLVTVTNAFGRSLQFAYDGSDRVATVNTPDGQRVGHSYDGAGRLASVLLPDNTSRGYHYEDARWPAALTGITDEAGVRYASFAYDAAGRAVSSQHVGGIEAYSMGYPASGPTTGTLITGLVVDPAIYQLTTTTTDPLGNAQRHDFRGGEGQIRLLGTNGAFEGQQMASRILGPGNLPDTETDFMGVQTMFTWDLSRQLKLTTTKAANRPEAQTLGMQWHPSFRLPVLVTEAGRTTAFSYDALGNRLSETVTDLANGLARTTQWTYTAQGLVETMRDARGAVWSYGYDGAGNRTSVRNPLNQQTVYGFDGAGRVTSQTDANGLATSYGYDPRGRLTTQSRGGETSTFGYTPAGMLAGVSLPSGYQVTYSYDAGQRLTGAQDNRGAVIVFTLDAMGNRTREEVRDAGGAIALVTGRAINSLNKLAAIQGAQNQTTALAYDANGEPIAVTDPLNQSTRQDLDGLRRPTATTFADNASATMAWNQLDQLTQVTDPKGVATSYQTNAFGEVTRETSPDIGAMTYQHDAIGDLAAVTDAVGNTTTIERDALGRPLRIQYAADNIATLGYDQGQAGYLASIDDQSGATTYQRDAQGRVLSKTQSVNDNPGSPSLFKVQYGYTNGELTSVTYPSGLKVFYRRTAGRITGIDVQEPSANPLRPKAVVPFVTGLAHSALGQPKAWSWASGDKALRSFDTDGRMTASEFASYSYDAASRITGISQSVWASRTVTMVVGTGTASVTQLYTTTLSWLAGYDSRNRLTSLVRDGASTSYSYDANSNRLTAVDKVSSDTDLDGVFDQDDFTQTFSQALNLDPASNRLLGFTQTIVKTNAGRTRSVVVTPITYSLDANGAMTSDGLRSFEYDASRRLSKVRIFKDGEAAKVTYLHNALGQRVFKSEPQVEQTLPDQGTLGLSFIDWLKKNFHWLFATAQSNTSVGTAFIYDEDANLLGEYDNGSATGKGRQEYIWLPTDDGQSIPIGIYKSGKTFAVHVDHLGTPRLITDEANKPVWQWPYSAFGNNKPTGVLKATPNPKAAITNKPVLLKATGTALDANLRFPGQYFDEESNLNYNYFRSYNGSQGRYTQPDPIGLGGGLNRLGYVGNAPLDSADPLGLWAVSYDFFFGLGWGMTWGVDEQTCQPFLTARAGAGANFSAQYDGKANRPGNPSHRGAGSTFAAYAQGGLGVSVLGFGAGAEAKTSAGTDYGNRSRWATPPWRPDVATQFGYDGSMKTGGTTGGSLGFEGGFYGESRCGCKN